MIGTSIFHMNIIMNYHCSHNCEAVANNVSVCLCYVIAHAHTQTDGTSNAEGDVLIAQHLSHQLMQPFPTHKYTTTPHAQPVDNTTSRKRLLRGVFLITRLYRFVCCGWHHHYFMREVWNWCWGYGCF